MVLIHDRKSIIYAGLYSFINKRSGHPETLTNLLAPMIPVPFQSSLATGIYRPRFQTIGSGVIEVFRYCGYQRGRTFGRAGGLGFPSLV
jgi:hypothetical protein